MRLFKFTFSVVLSSLLDFTSANTPLGQFYAYGKNISGLALFAGNGKVFIGNVSTSPISGAANLTFVESGTRIISHTLDGTSNSTNSSKYLGIDTTTGASKPVLITTSNFTSGYTTTGYYIYGEQITWLSSSREIQSNFYAVETELDSVWKLYWNSGSPSTQAGTPVVVKSLPPPTIGSTSSS